MTLIEFITESTVTLPQTNDMDVNMIFFGVMVDETATAQKLKQMLEQHRGTFNVPTLTPFDGKVHGYQEVGAWLGSQDLGLRLMALGAHLELWRLITPYDVSGVDANTAYMMAQCGMLSIVVEPSA